MQPLRDLKLLLAFCKKLLNNQKFTMEARAVLNKVELNRGVSTLSRDTALMPTTTKKLQAT